MFTLSHSFALFLNEALREIVTSWASLCCCNSIHIFHRPDVWHSKIATATADYTCKGLQWGIHHVNIIYLNVTFKNGY